MLTQASDVAVYKKKIRKIHGLERNADKGCMFSMTPVKNTKICKRPKLPLILKEIAGY